MVVCGGRFCGLGGAVTDIDQTFAATQAPPSLRRDAVSAWWRTGLAARLKQRRIEIMGRALGIDFFGGPGLSICDVGCGSGKDFIRPLAGTPHRLTGVDVVDVDLHQDNFEFIQTDAAGIPVPDGRFDLVVSFGVLEHIEPMEHLCEVVSEIRRIGKRFAVVVPCVATRLEPHVLKFGWPLQPVRERIDINYLSDQAWLKFEGFAEAKTYRFDYVPGLITNLMIVG